MQKIISKKALYKNTLKFAVGEEHNLEEIKQKLVDLGYVRYDLIDGRGQFSIRGGILDISISDKIGIRIEFWGDEIDSIRYFDIDSQLSYKEIDKVSIYPFTEFIVDQLIDDEDRKPKLFIIIGLILLVLIIIVIAVSCSITTSKKSSNTNLSYLRINGGVLEPNFSNSKTTYNVLTQNEYVEILCDTESTKSKVTGCNQKVSTKLNDNYTINIHAEDGTTKKVFIKFNDGEKTITKVSASVSIESNIKSGEETTSVVELNAVVTPKDVNYTYEWYKDSKKLDFDSQSIKLSSKLDSGDYNVKIYNKDLELEAISEKFVVKINDKTNKVNQNSSNTTSTNKNNKYVLAINNVSGNPSNWTKSATLFVDVSTSNGLAAKSYSFDGGKTYQSSNSKTFTSNQTVKIVVKDIKGNTTSKNVTIKKIDNSNPSVKLSSSNKTNISVVLNAITTPNIIPSGYRYEWYKNDIKIEGATSKSYKATESGTYKVKVITGTGNVATSNTYIFNRVVMHCPMISVSSASGKQVAPRTWFNEVVYVKIYPFEDTMSYDLYLNEAGVYDRVSNKYNYMDTFKNDASLKIVNGGLRVVKLVIRDNKGNSLDCYSEVYYLKK